MAEPGKIAQNAHGFQLPLDGVLVLADAEQILVQADNRYVGDLVRRQLRQADLIILNKTDLVSADKTSGRKGVSWHSRLPELPVLETTGGTVPLGLLFGAARPDRHWNAASWSSAHADKFHSWIVEGEQPLTETQFYALVRDLIGRAIRAKGYLALEESPDIRQLYQQVGSRWTLKPDGDWPEEITRMQIVAIGLSDRRNPDLHHTDDPRLGTPNDRDHPRGLKPKGKRALTPEA